LDYFRFRGLRPPLKGIRAFAEKQNLRTLPDTLKEGDISPFSPFFPPQAPPFCSRSLQEARLDRLSPIALCKWPQLHLQPRKNRGPSCEPGGPLYAGAPYLLLLVMFQHPPLELARSVLSLRRDFYSRRMGPPFKDRSPTRTYDDVALPLGTSSSSRHRGVDPVALLICGRFCKLHAWQGAHQVSTSPVFFFSPAYCFLPFPTCPKCPRRQFTRKRPCPFCLTAANDIRAFCRSVPSFIVCRFWFNPWNQQIPAVRLRFSSFGQEAIPEGGMSEPLDCECKAPKTNAKLVFQHYLPSFKCKITNALRNPPTTRGVPWKVHAVPST